MFEVNVQFNGHSDATILEKEDWLSISTFLSLRYLLSVKIVCMNIIWLLQKDGQKSEEAIKHLSPAIRRGL